MKEGAVVDAQRFAVQFTEFASALLSSWRDTFGPQPVRVFVSPAMVDALRARARHQRVPWATSIEVDPNLADHCTRIQFGSTTLTQEWEENMPALVRRMLAMFGIDPDGLADLATGTPRT